jgi:hypothetical protein
MRVDGRSAADTKTLPANSNNTESASMTFFVRIIGPLLVRITALA